MFNLCMKFPTSHISAVSMNPKNDSRKKVEEDLKMRLICLRLLQIRGRLSVNRQLTTR